MIVQDQIDEAPLEQEEAESRQGDRYYPGGPGSGAKAAPQ